MIPLIRLDQSQLGAVIALHHDMLAELAPGMAATETDQFFTDHLDACGQIFGAFSGDRLMAYCILGIPRKEDPNFGTDHGLSPDQFDQVAHIDGAAVDPAWRGQGWQRRMINHRLDIAKNLGRSITLSTVAPANSASLFNMISTGLTIRGLIQKFGGDRFLMRRDIDPAADQKTPPSTNQAQTPAIWCDSTDLVTCQKLLNDGYIGQYCQYSAPHSVPRIGWVAGR